MGFGPEALFIGTRPAQSILRLFRCCIPAEAHLLDFAEKSDTRRLQDVEDQVAFPCSCLRKGALGMQFSEKVF